MDAGAEQSLTARTFPPKLLVGRRFVSSQLRQTSNDGVSGSAPFKARAHPDWATSCRFRPSRSGGVRVNTLCSEGPGSVMPMDEQFMATIVTLQRRAGGSRLTMASSRPPCRRA